MHALVLISAFLCASAFAQPSQLYAIEEAKYHFEEFMKKFGKHYSNDQEKAARFEIFKANLQKVIQMNKESEHAVFGITQFMDLTKEEFTLRMTGLSFDEDNIARSGDEHFCETILRDSDIPDANAPDSFDWRQQGAVTPVKDQGQCGSCFAFSTTGNLEGQNFIKHNKLVVLSEQQIVDCDQTNGGCNGGLMALAFKNLAQQGGSVLESAYPYEAVQGQCRADQSQVAVKVSSCISYDLQSQEKVKQLLYKTGPISIGIRASTLSRYINGVLIDDHCQEGEIDHAVLLVGYGTDNKNMDYWIVKNSWGNQTFGEGGYFKMQRSNNPDGACGMMNNAMASAIVE